MKNLNFDIIYKDAQRFILMDDNSYKKTYPEFIKYFENIDEIEEHHLIISSHFVYGWMPTIMHLNLNKKGQVLFLLNAVKCGHILLESEFEILKAAINNSVVGLSKLLHFINPRYYAIWDSRIFRYITEKKTTYGISNVKNYISYLEGINEISKNKDYDKLHYLISKNFEYDVLPTRVIEVVMFETDRHRQYLKVKNK